ncbi:uncharacterized protein LOC113362903 [Ctenocephalides felis]|uniref:uncharacterized protein LOC113362903 n=1 Tax=Ctenocephalides felis TaxID=7515 RepID=UPI000E6E1378|nr:uncharacterized protein LOC113362903 [Ctenocephalides felis]
MSNILTENDKTNLNLITTDSNSSPICRACLADKNLQSLFIEQKQLSENENLILKMFVSCTALEVSPEDEYPKYICDLCLRDLYKAYEFWTKCRNSLQKLDKLKDKIQSVYIKNENDDLDVKSECFDTDNFETEVEIKPRKRSRVKKTKKSKVKAIDPVSFLKQEATLKTTR